MTVFWINLLVVFIFSLLARYNGKPAVIGPAMLKPDRLCAFAAAASLVLISGLRFGIGDTLQYMHSYVITGTNLDWAINGKDLGFNLLVVMLNRISRDPQLLIFVTALITNTLIVKVIYNYADPFELGTFLYITSGSYLVSMNGIRQFLASAIIFSATKWLIDGSWKRYFLLVCLASTLHLSALIMIPVYFVVRQKAWSRTTIVTMSVTLAVFIFFKPFVSVVFNAMGDNQYAHYRDYLFTSGLGANVIRIVIAAIPLALAFRGRVNLRKFWPQSDYIVNLSMVNFVFMLFSAYNWVLARFSIYFGLYNLLLLPWIIQYVFSRDSKRIMYFLVIACYLAFYYYENQVSLAIQYRSNYLNL